MGSARMAATIFFFSSSLRQSQNWILLEHRRDFGGKDLAGVAQDKSWREKEFGRVSSFHRTSLPLSGAGHWQGRGEGGDPGGIFLSSSIHTSSPIFQFSHFPPFTPVLPLTFCNLPSLPLFCISPASMLLCSQSQDGFQYKLISSLPFTTHLMPSYFLHLSLVFHHKLTNTLLQSPKPEQSVMQALESLNETQVRREMGISKEGHKS